MSEQGEKTCPLCMEEMDLTDQQLKPCKCGYEICVWCWHHIMDIAERDVTEGRCPACRAPYDKEKIVGMAANCERLVAEINSERKLKSKSAKPKNSEGRKHLSSVRVIQRNLVYIIGIPSNLADEDLLQRKEYFGQYGKVLKVSISRNAGGAIQHSANNTCSVYITYLKEEEAVRCIQSVHEYVLDGKPLKACFGTTKYCHTWLRNMSCSNPDCLYLHEIGTQEDSFTKDEIISAYTRSRVQQITGATNNLQRRSGNTLPPPADEVYSSCPSSGKPIAKSVQNNPVSQVKISPPNDSTGRSIALPASASWGLRVSNGRPPTASLACSNGSAKQRIDAYTGSFPLVVASTTQGSTLLTDVGKKTMVCEDSQKLHPNGNLGLLESSEQYIIRDYHTTVSDTPSEVVRNAVPVSVTSGNQSYYLPTSKDSDRGIAMPPNVASVIGLDSQSCSPSDEDIKLAMNGTNHSPSSRLTSVGIHGHHEIENSDVIKPNDSLSNFLSFRSPGNHGAQQYHPEHFRETLSSLPVGKFVTESDGVSLSRESTDWRSESPTQVLLDSCREVEEDLPALDEQRWKVSEVVNGHSWKHGDACSTSNPGNMDGRAVHTNVNGTLHPFTSCDLFSNGSNENKVSSSGGELENIFGSPYLFSNVEKGKYLGRFKEDVTAVEKAASADMGESSIISNILSLDFGALDDSLTSPNNLAKLLGETDKQHGSLKISSPWKVQNTNQSRFSFARQENFATQSSDLELSLSNIEHVTDRYSVPQNSLVNRDVYLDKLQQNFPFSILDESDASPSSQSIISSNKLSVSRAQISAPPGFSVPSRAPPPGFSTQERMDQAFDSISGNHFLENSSLPRNQYLAQPTGNFGSIADVEFIDPAILAVGKGRLPNGVNSSCFDMRSTFSPQLSASENDPRIQLLLQQSMSAHQNLRFPGHIGDRFSPLADSYRMPTRLLEQSHASNLPPIAQLSLQQSRNAQHISNGQWDGWNEVQAGNGLGMAELLRNERLGFNKHFPGYENLKFRMPSSGDIYNSRAFGI